MRLGVCRGVSEGLLVGVECPVCVRTYDPLIGKKVHFCDDLGHTILYLLKIGVKMA